MNETTKRIVVAIPWLVFALAIIAAGGPIFAAALVFFGIIGLREFFVMASPLSWRAWIAPTRTSRHPCATRR